MADKLKQGITFQTTQEMHRELHNISKRNDLTVSHLLRQLVREFLRAQVSMETKSSGDLFGDNKEKKEVRLPEWTKAGEK